MTTPIERDELAAKLRSGSIVLLDAQAPGWYEREHVRGAKQLDWDDIAGSVQVAVPDLAREIAVYCWNTTCTGSEIAAHELERLGYVNVRRYIGGKQDWADHGGDLVKDSDAASSH